MNKKWKKFDELTGNCYIDMACNTSDMNNWNQAFALLLDIIQEEREKNQEFGAELFELEDEIDYGCDVSGWLEDYMDELDMREMHEQLLQVCRTLLDLFAWKEDSPSDIKVQLISVLQQLGRFEEAEEECEAWYAEEADNVYAATAMIYLKIKLKKYPEAEQIIHKYIKDDSVCTEENDIIYTAAEQYYKTVGDKKKAKEIAQILKQYEADLEAYFMGMDDEDFDLEDDDLPFS